MVVFARRELDSVIADHLRITVVRITRDLVTLHLESLGERQIVARYRPAAYLPERPVHDGLGVQRNDGEFTPVTADCRRNDGIQINDEIGVFVVSLQQECVRLGVQCPQEISVHRGEIYDAIIRFRDSEDTKLEKP